MSLIENETFMNIAYAPSLSALNTQAAKYFFRPVRCEVPFVYTQSGTGFIPGFEVVKKRKLFYLIKL